MIFDVENWLWKSDFGTFWHLTITPIRKIPKCELRRIFRWHAPTPAHLNFWPYTRRTHVCEFTKIQAHLHPHVLHANKNSQGFLFYFMGQFKPSKHFWQQVCPWKSIKNIVKMRSSGLFCQKCAKISLFWLKMCEIAIKRRIPDKGPH